MPQGDAKHVAKLRNEGIVSFLIMSTLLFCVHYFLHLSTPVYVAVGIQMAVFFFHGLPNSSEKYFDISGSFTHLALVCTSLLSNSVIRSPRQIFISVASIVWMTRLGSYLYARILKDGKDERMDNFKLTFVSWIQVWMFQAAWVTIIQLPILLLNAVDDSSHSSVSLIDGICIVLWIVGFIIEVMADTEKMVFRSQAKNKHKYITTGIWSVSRHPNYFGEILMWVSLALMTSNAGLDHTNSKYFFHAAWASPLFTFLLLRFVSGVPMVEKAGQKKWGSDTNYVKYMKETSMIVPWFAPNGIKRE